MATRAIPRERWKEFFDSLSRDHHLRDVTVQVSDPELGFQIEMRAVPLVGVSADLLAGGGPRIEVMVGRTEADHTTHSVLDPKAVNLDEGEQGEPLALEIEAGSGSKTLVLLKPSAFGEPGTLMEREQG
jgi:hypothetical protein